jgi:UDP-N-acetylglucosamine 2-epimerase (non-hydrolysing)
MIIFLYGTTAEAIKLAPIARRLDAQGIPYQQWLTLQQSTRLLDSLPGLGLREPDHIIANGRDGRPLTGSVDVLHWLNTIRKWLRSHRRELRQSLPAKSVILVHGDTMTSVVGAFIARSLKIDSAHVEAGLRSGTWRHPFPEELDRRIVGKMADVHYPPSLVAVNNLGKRKNVVYTHGNTVTDAILDRADAVAGNDHSPFGLVLLHRFEFVNNTPLVERTMATLATHATLPLKLIVDDHARHALAAQLGQVNPDRMQVVEKLEHAEFMDVIGRASFVVTDSGGVQEEMALLGIPTLVHRKATERDDGLGKNALLSEWDTDRLASFLDDFQRYRVPRAQPEHSPSDIIVKDLQLRGYHH